MPDAPQSTTVGLIIAGAGTALTACVVAIARWLGTRDEQAAPLLQAANDTLRLVIGELRNEIARLKARILEQEQEIDLLNDLLGDARRDLAQRKEGADD